MVEANKILFVYEYYSYIDIIPKIQLNTCTSKNNSSLNYQIANNV